MRLSDALFPGQHRALPGRRWWTVILRTLHLLGLAGIGGAYLLRVSPDGWQAYLWLTIGSGVGLVALELWRSGIWLIQVQGIAIMAKLFLLAMIPVLPGFEALLFIAVIVISGVVSHAPARVRHYSLLHSRHIDAC